MKRIVLAVLMCFLLTSAVLPATAFAAQQVFFIRNGSITVEERSAGLTVTQNGISTAFAISDTLLIDGEGTTADSTCENNITVRNVGTAAVPLQMVLKGVHIYRPQLATGEIETVNILDLDRAQVVLTLQGENSLVFKGDEKAAVHVPDSSGLTIQGDGSLTAKSVPLNVDYSSRGAGIGGNGSVFGSGEACGRITITGSADVTAQCGITDASDTGAGAGIGGGSGRNAGSAGGTIEISGQARVRASSGIGAGVGGGACYAASHENDGSGNGASVIVKDSARLEASSVSGAGIGSGCGRYACGSGGRLIVEGGTVIAISTDGAGIGGGASLYRTGGEGGQVAVEGGTVSARSTNGAGIGGGAGTNDDSSGGSGGTLSVLDNGALQAASVSGAAIGGGYAKDAIGGPAKLNLSDTYEWSCSENGAYTVCQGSNPATAFPNPNLPGFNAIRVNRLTASVLPGNSFPAGQCGGDYTVTIGAGTDLTYLNAAFLSPDALTLTNGSGAVVPLVRDVDYTIPGASATIVLKEACLNALPAGRYLLSAHIALGRYAGQTPTLSLIVIDRSPETGDRATPGLWLALCTLAGLGALALIRTRRRI